MHYLIPLLIQVLLLVATQAAAVEVTSLAKCTTRVFDEINSTHKWSGKSPAGCTAEVAVEKRTAGVFVTAWATEPAAGGWVRIAFSAAANYAELAAKKELAKVNHDVMARAERLDNCLYSIKTINDPRECRSQATRSYLVGEETGTEDDRLIWLNDNGRYTVVEYAFGDTEETPTPPADLFEGNPLPPGVTIELYRKVDATLDRENVISAVKRSDSQMLN